MTTVQSQGADAYHVTVQEGSSSTEHTVDLDDGYYRKLARADESQEELIRRSFEFLLQREPKESILARFHLSEIGRYFSDYEQTVGRS